MDALGSDVQYCLVLYAARSDNNTAASVNAAVSITVNDNSRPIIKERSALCAAAFHLTDNIRAGDQYLKDKSADYELCSVIKALCSAITV